MKDPRIFCKVCKHAQVELIDRTLAEGKVSHRDLATTYSLSRHSIDRHSLHLPRFIAKHSQKVQGRHADRLVERLGGLVDEARRLQQKAEDAGDVRAAISALRELTRLLEVEAKIAGEIKGKTEVTNVLNVHMDEQTATRVAQTFLARRERPALP